jgi:hypothetical protein
MWLGMNHVIKANHNSAFIAVLHFTFRVGSSTISITLSLFFLSACTKLGKWLTMYMCVGDIDSCITHMCYTVHSLQIRVEIGLYIGGTTYLGQTISIYIMLKYLTIWNQLSQAKPRYILKPDVKSTPYLQAMDRVTHMSNTRIDIPNTHIHGQSLPELGTHM